MANAQPEERVDNSRRQRFERIWAEHYAAVFRYARRRTSDEQLARDVAADTFLVAWRRFDEIPGDVRPWLLRVARNHLANQYRGHRRRVALQARLESSFEGPSAESETGDHSAIADAFNRLRAVDREALALIAWEGMKPREAARVLGITAALFSVRLHRARQRFRKELGQAGNLPSDADAALNATSAPETTKVRT